MNKEEGKEMSKKLICKVCGTVIEVDSHSGCEHSNSKYIEMGDVEDVEIKELSKYIGKWVAVVDSKVIAVGISGKEVFDEAKKLYPELEPFIMKVPKNELTLL